MCVLMCAWWNKLHQGVVHLPLVFPYWAPTSARHCAKGLIYTLIQSCQQSYEIGPLISSQCWMRKFLSFTVVWRRARSERKPADLGCCDLSALFARQSTAWCQAHGGPSIQVGGVNECSTPPLLRTQHRLTDYTSALYQPLYIDMKKRVVVHLR